MQVINCRPCVISVAGLDLLATDRGCQLLYFILALLSTAVGALSGIGGGLIIRPSLSLLGVSLGLATFTSAASVFVMSAVTVVARQAWKTSIKFGRLIYLAVGSVVGAFAGAYVLRFLSPVLVSVCLIAVMAFMGALLILKKYIKPRVITNPFLGSGVGFSTGFLSGLFGIGGGPFQMIALMFLFGSKPKEAVVQSLFIAMLASGASLIQYWFNGFADLSLLIYVLPGSILGGLVGYFVAKRVSDKFVVILLFMLVLVVIVSQVYVIAAGIV